MLTSIHIQGFKGFRDTKIPELRRVNLILGGQNSGKTSLLEAVYGAYSFNSFNTSMMMDSFNFGANSNCGLRKNSGHRAINWSATGGIKNANVTFCLEKNNDKPHVMPSVFSVYPVEEHELVRLYDIAVKNKTKKQWIGLLKLIEGRLESLESISADGEAAPSVHAEIDAIHRLMPLSVLGQGFNRLAYLYAGLLGQNANIALIDEIENGIHYSALPILWQGIANIARELDIQIFATTHSLECIRAASDAFKDSPDDFQVIRLNRKGDNIEADIIPHDYVEAVVMHGGEIR